MSILILTWGRTLGEDQFAPGSFDVVMFRGVIEHMIDLRAALQRASAEAGWFVYFCATPNADSFRLIFTAKNGRCGISSAHQYLQC